MRFAVPLLLVLALRAWAVEGIPNWSRVLDDVLRRAETEPVQQSEAAAQVNAAAVADPAVRQFVRYYGTQGAGTWSNSVRRLQPIRPMMQQILVEEGVPEELLWVGLVESGYRPSARSPKNAAGIWQFIPDTARRFGLAVSAAQDERFHIGKATRAAARYLRFLYATFGDWRLSLAAYNAGERRVQSAIDRSQSRDFEVVSRFLPRETQAYVPAVLAAQILGGGAPPSRSAVASKQVVQAPFSLSP